MRKIKKYAQLGLILILILTIALTGCGSGGSGNPSSNDPPSNDLPSNDPPKHGTNYYLYVTNTSNNISAFSINPANGGLTSISGSPFAAGTSPSSVAADPSGKFLYVANTMSHNISIYSINAVTGVLDKVTDSQTNYNPEKVTVDPSGNFVAVGCLYYLNIFSRDKSSGSLSNRVSFNFASDQEMKAVSFDRTGQYLYVAVSTGTVGAICVYAKNTGANAFTPISGSPFTTCIGPTAIAVEPNDQFLYVSSSNSTAISIHSINIDGSPGTGNSVNILAQSSSLLTEGNFLYIATHTGISAYSIVNPGLITKIGITIPLAAGITPKSLALDPSGKFLYVTGWYSNNIWVCSRSTVDGGLTAITESPFDIGSEITSIVTLKPIP